MPTETPAPTWRLTFDAENASIVASETLNVVVIEGSGPPPKLELLGE